MFHRPGHRFWRRVLFWTLVVIYFCAVSVIIPYTFGYRFSVERGVFVYSGSLTLKTTPRDVRITVDGAPIDAQRNFINESYHLTGLAPGSHTIHVSADGFLPYEKRVDVTSGMSTELWNIVLPRTSYERTPLLTHGSDRFFRAPDTKHIAWAEEVKSALTVFTASLGDATEPTAPIASIAHATLDDAYNIEWSPQSDAVIIPVQFTKNTEAQKTHQDVFVTFLDHAFLPTATQSLRSLFPTANVITDVRWDPQQANALFARIDHALVHVAFTQSPATKTLAHTITPIASPVRTYTIAHDTLYYVDETSRMIYKMTDTMQKPEQITTHPITLDGSLVLVVYDDERLTVRERESGTLLFANPRAQNPAERVRTLGTDVRGVRFSDDGKKILFWTQNDIAVFFVRDWDVQPVRAAGEFLSLAHFAQPLGTVTWAKDYEHVLYIVGNDLKITELDARGGRITRTLISLTAPSLFDVDYDAHTIYIAEHTADHTIISSIPFPEKTPLFN